MEMIRKSVKALGVSVGVFIILTLISAAVIYVTAIKELWNHEIMIVLMVISAVFAGVLEAKIVGKRMLFVFLITAFLFTVIVYGTIYMIFKF